MACPADEAEQRHIMHIRLSCVLEPGKKHHSVVIRFHWSCIFHTLLRRIFRGAFRDINLDFLFSHILCTVLACYSGVDYAFPDCGMRLSRQEPSDRGVLHVSLLNPAPLTALQVTERWHFCTSPQKEADSALLAYVVGPFPPVHEAVCHSYVPIGTTDALSSFAECHLSWLLFQSQLLWSAARTIDAFHVKRVYGQSSLLLSAATKVANAFRTGRCAVTNSCGHYAAQGRWRCS